MMGDGYFQDVSWVSRVFRERPCGAFTTNSQLSEIFLPYEDDYNFKARYGTKKSKVVLSYLKNLEWSGIKILTNKGLQVMEAIANKKVGEYSS